LKTDIFEGFVRKKSVYCNTNQSSDLSTFPMVGEGNSGKTVNYKRENSTEVHQSDNYSQSVNMEKQNPSCIDCGTLFSTPFAVQRHIKRGCPMDENAPEPKRILYDEDIDDDNDNQSIDSKYNEDEDNDDSAFDPLIDDVYEQLNEDHQKRVDKIMEEQGINKTRAKEEVNEFFLPCERRLLIKEYRQLLSRMYALKQSSPHRQITSKIQNLVEKKACSFDKATSLVLKRNRYLFDELLDYEDDKSEEESDDKNADDEDSDDSNDDNNEDDLTFISFV
jgi:hypothetical protein